MEQELADNVHKAIDALNRAVQEAEGYGTIFVALTLTQTAEVVHGFSRQILVGDVLKIISPTGKKAGMAVEL